MPARTVRTAQAATTNPAALRCLTGAAGDADSRSAPAWFFEFMKAPDENQSGVREKRYDR